MSQAYHPRRMVAALVLAVALCAPAAAQTVSWSILDNDIKDDIVTHLKSCPLSTRDSIYVDGFNPNDSVFVVAGIDEAGPVIQEFRLMGRPIRNACLADMPRWLADTILHRIYPWVGIGGPQVRTFLRDTEGAGDVAMLQYVRNADWMGTGGMELAFPSRFAVRFAGSSMGVFGALGEEQLGFPGSSISTLKLGAGFGGVRFHVTLPVVTLTPTRIEGVLGVGVAFSAGGLGGSLQFGEVPKFSRLTLPAGGAIVETSFLQNAGLLYYQTATLLGGDAAIRVRAGAAVYQITRGHSTDGASFRVAERLLYGGAWLRMDWVTGQAGGGVPRLELALQALLGNRSSILAGWTWNPSRTIGLMVQMVYTVRDDASVAWSESVLPWGAVLVRL